MKNNTITGLPKGTSILEQNGIKFVSVKKEMILGETIEGIQIADMDTYMGVGRYNIHSGKYSVILAMIAESVQSILVEDSDGFKLTFSSIDENKLKDKTDLLCFATGDNPYELSEKIVAAYANKVGTFKMRKEKSVPKFVDLLGWCTWNAWFQDVSEKLVLEGLEVIKNKKIPVKFMILDDGWQDAEERYLNSFTANDKFPSGLSELAKLANILKRCIKVKEVIKQN